MLFNYVQTCMTGSTLLWLLFLFCFVSCSLQKEASPISQEPDPAAYESYDDYRREYNKCFGINFNDGEFVYGDTIISFSKKGNYHKYLSISDTQFIWSVGRSTIEKLIDTMSCERFAADRRQLDWETKDFMVYVRSAGTGCWSNTIIPLHNNDSIFYLQYRMVDMENMNAISIFSSGFSITNLYTQKELLHPIPLTECVDGYLPFFINETELKGTTISYTITCGDKTEVRYTIEVPEIVSLGR